MDLQEWEFDRQTKTWVCGTDTNGCGAFKYGDEWSANVVVDGVVENLGSFDSLEEAKAAALGELKEKLGIE